MPDPRRKTTNDRTPARRIAPRGAWLVPAVVAAAGVAGALAYAGRGAASVLYVLIVDGGAVVLWLAAAAGWGAWPTGWLMGNGDGRSRDRRGAEAQTPVGPREPTGSTPPLPDGRGSLAAGTQPPPVAPMIAAVTAVAVGQGVLGLLTLGFGLAGLLGGPLAWGLLWAGCALGAGWLWARRTSIRSRAADGATPPAGAWRWLWLLAAPGIASVLVAATVPPGFLWKPEEPHGFDAVEYHLQVPREWAEAGRIVPLTHNAFSYFPFGVEMHYLLAILLKGGAWQGMYLAQLMHAATTALAVAAACGFVSHLAPDRRFGVIASVAGATVPWLALLAPLAFNEAGLLLHGTLSVGWALHAVRRETTARPAGTPAGDAARPRPSPRPLVIAGVLAGLACGAKLTAVPLLLAALPLATLVVLVRRSPRRAVTGAVAFGLAGSAVFAPWLVRNVAWTGNPVFPEGTAVFGRAHFTDAQVERWSRAHAAQPDKRPPAARAAAFGTEVLANWQFGYVLLPLCAACLAAGWRRPEARVLTILLLFHTAFWLVFTHLQGRFFVLSIPIAVLAIATAPWDRLSAGARRVVPPVLAAVVAVAAVYGWWNVHRRLAEKLTTASGPADLRLVLGDDRLGWQTADVLAGFPLADPSAELLLVGEAQAFWFPLPAGRLRYRTPFDVPGGPGTSIIDGYGVPADRHDRTWLLVSPGEVERFRETYQPFPSIPEPLRQSPEWRAGGPMPYLVPPHVPVAP